LKVILGQLKKILNNEKWVLSATLLGSIGLTYMTYKIEYDERCDIYSKQGYKYEIIHCPISKYA